MGEFKQLTIQGNVNKIITLYENEALELEETRKLLKQFNKDDLIEALLGEGLEEEEVTDSYVNGKKHNEGAGKSKIIKKEVNRVKETETDLDFDEDEDEDEEDDLDL